jgi:hypothetical protein
MRSSWAANHERNRLTMDHLCGAQRLLLRVTTTHRVFWDIAVHGEEDYELTWLQRSVRGSALFQDADSFLGTRLEAAILIAVVATSK